MAVGTYKDSPVSQAVEMLGGLNKCAAKMSVTRQAISLWRAAGYVSRRDMAIRLARLSGVPFAAIMGVQTPHTPRNDAGAA